MELRLTYAGPLLVTRTDNRQEYARAPHKHSIRRQFHRQVRRFWQIHPALKNQTQVDSQSTQLIGNRNRDSKNYPRYIDRLADSRRSNGFRFVPLVTKENGLRCRLDILLLRGTSLGSPLQNSDIDNRLKTLFDGLQMPDANQIKNESPQSDEDPFFVLLEDDRLVTKVSVETDTLLQHIDESREDDINDVRLIISCKVWPYFPGPWNMDFM